MVFSHNYLLFLLMVYIETTKAQFMPSVKKVSKSNACDGTKQTALVEHFFNVIFTEFHNSPPVCVCVQMCADQPTYCYPNGCLKKVDSKKKNLEESRPSAPVNVQSDDISKTMFLIDENNVFSHLFNDNVESNKNVPAERTRVKDLRPDPFKDRYKTLFKYKKMPKVELRYNLREQVKNMKSDILKIEQDVSKTRWPKKHHMILQEQKTLLGDKNDDTKSADKTGNKFFIQDPGIERDVYSTKFFKRDLRRNIKDDVDDQSEYSTDNPDISDGKTFSLETLIENLIGNNFERKPDFDTGLKVNPNDSQAIINATKDFDHYNTTADNKEVCVISINMTNENLDENKYEESPLIKKHLDKWKNYTFNEMIATLAKRIEKQNNTSLEIMNNATRDEIEVTITGPINNLKEKESSEIINSHIKERASETPSISYENSHKNNLTNEKPE